MTSSFLLAAVAVVPLLYACNSAPQQGADTGALQDYPVMTVTPQMAMLSTDYPAALEGQRNIEIRPKVDGFVEQIFVDEGATVKKGQALFKIHAPQYEQEVRTAQAAIKSAAAEVSAAKMQVNKVLPLVQKEIVSNYELEAAQLALQAKEAALAQAQASLANALTNLGYTTIKSPADGLTGSIPYKIGSLVSSGSPQPLTTVSDITRVYAYFSFNEKQFLDFSRLHPGKNMLEKLNQLSPVSLILSNGEAYGEAGQIETAGGMINTGTGAVSLRATFSNPAGLIRSGGSAIVRIGEKVGDALLIPSKATFETQGKKFVFVVDPSGTVKSTAIEVMELLAGDDYVVKAGIRAGDKVVTTGMSSLRDGMKINPVPLSVTASNQTIKPPSQTE